MKKIRCFLATIALLATLSGFSLSGMGAALMTNAALSQHVTSISSPFATEKAANSVALKFYGPCPEGGSNDC